MPRLSIRLERAINFSFPMAISLAIIVAMPKATLEQLLAGNRRYEEKGHQFIKAQNPKAMVLCCSDSRVPPEIIFDQDVGELFIVRVAGNIAAPSVIDSLIFGATVLKVPLLVVLGHQDCGAIQAVLQGGDHLLQLSHLFPYLEGAIYRAEDKSVKAVTIANVFEQIAFLRANPMLAPLIRAGTLDVVGAYYDLEKGKVQFLKSS